MSKAVPVDGGRWRGRVRDRGADGLRGGGCPRPSPARRPVGRPGPRHPRGAGPHRRGRGDRDRRRARRPQEHRLPVGRHARGAPPRRADRGPGSLPPRGRHPAAGRRHHGPARPGAGGPSDLPPAGRGHRRDGQRRGPLGELGALPRPGRGLVGPPAPQLGRPAHPAARHEQRQGAAERPRRVVAGSGPRHPRDVHPPHDHPPTAAARRAGPRPRPGLRARGRRARGRPHRGGRTRPQRARRRGGLDERLRAVVPAAARAPRGGRARS